MRIATLETFIESENRWIQSVNAKKQLSFFNRDDHQEIAARIDFQLMPENLAKFQGPALIERRRYLTTCAQELVGAGALVKFHIRQPFNVNAKMIELSKGRVLLDIGASTGEYMARMSQSGSHVYAFEPHPDNVVVCTHMAASMPNVTVVPAAVSSNDGQIDLFVCARSTTQHTLSPLIAKNARWGHSLDRHISVPSIKLDTFCQQNNVSGPMGIKIDVEAAEEFVIQGGLETLKNNDCIIAIETHGEIDAGNLTRMFYAAGYKWWDMDRNRCFSMEPDKSYLCVVATSDIIP